MKLSRILALSFCLSVLLLPAAAGAAQERIRSFDSHIDVFADGSVIVRETIRVVAAGKKIRRGIYRDFPTRYKNDSGHAVTVRFEVLEVRRNDRPEAYHTEKRSNGLRVYIGQKDVVLRPGEYTYTLTYRTDRQIGFFDDYDELYWNVTGNGWEFVIDEVRAVIQLPRGAEVVEYAAYTGPSGARGQDYQAIDTDDGFGIATTRSLKPREGLTIAVAWPKGYVVEPDTAQRIGFFLADHRGVVLSLGGLLLLLMYYLIAWLKVGRDPSGGAVIPRYTPPDGISPAGMRFILRMGFDKKALAVAVVNMAVKGGVAISEDDDGFSLTAKRNQAVALSPGEAKVAKHLFPPGQATIVMQKSSHRRIKAALKGLRNSLTTEYEKAYFLRNTAYFIPGLIVSLAAFGGIVATADPIPVALFMLVWLSGWSAGVYTLMVTVIAAWRSRQVAGAMAITLFSVPFLIGEVVGLGMLATAVSPANLIVFLAIVAVNILFYHLLKAPTLAGRRLMDEIEGLKLYMQVAEKERLNLLNPPERTPQHFEALLPFAMALDVENDWNEQFADFLAAASAGDSTAGGYHSPAWYRGQTPFTGLASSLGGSFASAVSASSSAPGSSSGSSGGGSSGGGGGGGGGGGW